MTITSNPMKLMRQFSDLQADLSGKDSKLAQWERNGNTYPSQGVADSFKATAADLDAATLGLMDLHPDKAELHSQLKSATLWVARSGGKISGMANNQDTFGRGWSNTLDSSVKTTQACVDATLEDASGATAEKPNPLKVAKSLADLQSNLTRWDANLTSWQREGNTYPSRSVEESIDGLASALYDARNQMRALHPDQTALIDSLGKNSLWVSSNAGKISNMANHHPLLEGAGPKPWTTPLAMFERRWRC